MLWTTPCKPLYRSQALDRTLTYPKGIVENLLVKVRNFIYTGDYVMLGMEEDKEVPISLGQPFLNTGGVLIDVRERKLT